MEILAPDLVEFGSAGLVLALFLGTFVSEDLACITAGSLIAAEKIDPFSAVLACLAGIVAGDLMLFAAGRLFGRKILASRLGSRFISPRSVERASAWLAARGTSAIFISRFLSGLRLPTYFLSGLLHLDTKRFGLLATLGAAIWTPVIVLAAAFWNMTMPLGAIGAFVVFFFVFRFAFQMTDWRRRRILAGKIKRIWKWEFWPLWLFYFPVVIYVAFLAIRFRGLHFTAANPGMPAGGFVGESKDAIYDLIAASEAADRHLLRYVRVTAGSDDGVRKAVDLVRAVLSYPVVVKPDAGERGNGVSIVQSKEELAAALDAAADDVLVQEFVEGVEASIFYYRYPGEEHGRIFSITEKIFPFVTGDGASTLEELILRDRRAHIIAENYFRRNESRLYEIPPAGEKVPIVDIGTHSKGAIFHDGGRLLREELESSIDALCRNIPGFYFGRFDLRAESFEALMAGDFKIIELNGVTSESTNIYDPRYSLLDAYQILFLQWRIAFEIGRRNEFAGAQRASLSELIRLYTRSRWTDATKKRSR